MATGRPRSIRGVEADINRAAKRVQRAAASSGIAAVATFGAAAWAHFYEHETLQAFALIACGLIMVICAFYIVRLSRVAAATTFLCYAGVGVWLATRPEFPFQAGYVYLGNLVAMAGAIEVFRLPGYYKEFQSLWKPHQITPGEVYTVRDGNDFSVVKVLAVEPDRVHIKQFGLRYPERPWQVKSSTLARDATVNGGRRYPHLPLDFAEFLRWEPALLRKEPLAAHELEALNAWVAIHGAPESALQ